jgi:predicted MFS family arabinose efflux permease
LPLITFVSGAIGWRGAFAAASLTALIPFILVLFGLPRALYGPPLSLHSFNVLAHNRKILLLLLITILPISGQLIVFVYLAPLLQKLTGASHEVIGLMFALFGAAAFIGNVIATRIVGRLGAWATSGLFLSCMLTGLLLWSLGAGYLPVMAVGIAFIGAGFAASNSMQQARLVQAAPELASASVALNTSAVYVGQAIGSGAGGILFGLDRLHGIGFVGLAFAAAGMAVWSMTRDTPKRAG